MDTLTPMTKRNTIRRMAITPGYTPVKNVLRKAGYQIRLSETAAELGVNTRGKEVGNAVREFLNSDEVSAQCPDKSKSANLRYRKDYLCSLHEKFVVDTDISISYATFTRHVTSNIKKPKAEDWGTCLCKMCHNPQLKVEGLLRCLRALKNKSEEGVSLESLTEMTTAETDKFVEEISSMKGTISYLEWQSEASTDVKKKGQPDPTTVSKTYRSVKKLVVQPAKVFATKLQCEINDLREHNKRMMSQFRRIREIKQIVADPSKNAIAIRIDWSENQTLFQVRQEKSAYYHDLQVSVNTVVIYGRNGEVTSAGSISDCKSHKSAAILASLSSIMNVVGISDNVNTVYIISDSPMSQYRNCQIAYLTKKFAEETDITVYWTFTESGHGKGPMDGVGAAIKRMVDDIVAFNPDAVIASARDILPLLPPSNIMMSTYSQSDVDTFQAKVPPHLSLIWKHFGISIVHEIHLPSISGSVIHWKRLSSDKNYTSVIFKYSTVN